MRKTSTKPREPRIVRFKVDPDNPPPVTAAQKARLEKLAAMPDEDIDFSDIPPMSDDALKNAIPNPFFWKQGPDAVYRPIKKQLTVRLDADVLVWLRSAGPGYQTKLNAILREAMQQDLEAQAERRRTRDRGQARART